MSAVVTKKSHSKYSASGSERWLKCPASVSLSEKAPVPVESIYAVEGTTAHFILEEILKAHIANKKPYTTAHLLKEKYPPEMVQHALDAYKEIVGLCEEGDELFCEQKIDLEFIHPGLFGTLDAAVVSSFGKLTIIDFKYGAGISVEPEENSQLLYYALGLAHRYDYNFSDVILRIIQPRAFHPVSTSREWVTTVKRLRDFTQEIKLALTKSKEIDPPFLSGTHCRWCPAAVICPELSKTAMVQAGLDFDIVDTPETELSIPPIEKLGETLSAISKLETWFDRVKEFALQSAERGTEIKGYKLVEKRSTRKWIDEESTIKAALPLHGDLIYTERELLSPAQFEKMTKNKEFVRKNTIDVSFGTTLVPESDRRKAVKPLEDFDSLENT